MVGSTTGKPAGIKMVTRFAYAAGGMGIPANLFLIALLCPAGQPPGGWDLARLGQRPGGISRGRVHGPCGTRPVRMVARPTLEPDHSGARTVGTGGPHCRRSAAGSRDAAFDVQAPVAVGAWMVLCLWLLLVNRWLRLSAAIGPRVARFGEFLGWSPSPAARSPGWVCCCHGCRCRSW